jgi:ATP-binding cassette, subfamily B, bacterial
MPPAPGTTTRSTLRRLLELVAPHRHLAFVGTSASLALVLVGLAPPYLTGRLVDGVLASHLAGELPAQEAARAGAALVALIAAAILSRQLLLWLRLRPLATLGERVAKELRRQVFDAVQSLRLSQLADRPTGGLVSRVTSDTDRVSELLSFGLVETALAALSLTAASAALLLTDWRLGLVATLPLPFLLLAIHAHGRALQRRFTLAWRRWEELTQTVADVLPGMPIVKAFHQERRERARFSARNTDMTSAYLSVHHHWTTVWPLLIALYSLAIIALYFLALPRLLEEPGTSSLSLGNFVTFLLYLGLLLQPIETFGQMARTVNRSLSSARRIFEMIDMRAPSPPIPSDHSPAPTPAPLDGSIVFDDVTFSYSKGRTVLAALTLTIPRGEIVGIVGDSGAGKSTLLQLVPDLYSPDRGLVALPPHPLAPRFDGRLRRHIGYAPQDPFLFHGSVRENLLYSWPPPHSEDAPEDPYGLAQIIDAARAAVAHDLIAKLPLAYDTILGERGASLSGGERQRLAIARALVHQPAILLLDEPTSQLDPHTEETLMANLVSAARARAQTVIIVAHRSSTLQHADRILTLDAGRLAGDVRRPQAELAFRATTSDSPLDPTTLSVRDRTLISSSLPGRSLTASPLFPLTAPGRFLSLRAISDDRSPHERAMILDPAEIPDPHARQLALDLASRSILLTPIIGVTHLEEDDHHRTWHVMTGGGPASVETRIDAWPRPLPDSRSLISSTSGQHFLIPPSTSLDRASRRLLWALLDQ